MSFILPYLDITFSGKFLLDATPLKEPGKQERNQSTLTRSFTKVRRIFIHNSLATNDLTDDFVDEDRDDEDEFQLKNLTIYGNAYETENWVIS